MKTVSCKSFFKKVSAKQAESMPALADKVGIKRPDLEWSFESYEAADVAAVDQAVVAFFLNSAIEAYGRSLVSDPENAANWEFVPTGLTLTQAFDAANAETSRARVLTKVTATAFAKFYSTYAPELLGIKKEAAVAAESVIAGWLTFGKKEGIRAAMHARLSSFAAILSELPEDHQAVADFVESLVDLAAVLDALIKAFSPDQAPEIITADSL